MLILSTVLENITSRKDRSWKLTFGTQELLPDQVKGLSLALDKFIYLALKVEDFKSEEIKLLDEAKAEYDDTSKSQAQRIRSVLFILWKQGNGGYEDFELYYKHHTEKIIEHLKSKIDP